ncbi:hypothetical protein [Wenyingzhuangia aestuarii]|uniref:hypothetical protein n=1 Tax=Wenyingzhuangia aestuarii TaxID=1647582 RepID=UPI001438D2B5|nr:hypothetical protein [Wenyingzhuangia aestuarii]NJB82362.1 hypothetical protein [Wenyingzhuangia aestuarii]
MKQLQIKMLELTTNSSEAKTQINSLLKSNLSYLNKEDFGKAERYGEKVTDFYVAIEKLKNQQAKVLGSISRLKPNQKVQIDCQINLKFY